MYILLYIVDAAVIKGNLQACKPGYFALTFDDGPNTYTPELIDTLNQQGIPATFFINGLNFIIFAQDAIAKAYRSGHQIASHTYTHPHLTELSDKEIEIEMLRLENQTMHIIGKRPAYMRPPFGDINKHIIDLLNNLGYTIVTWSLDTKDYETHNLSDEMKSVSVGMEGSSHGYIALTHDVYKQTVEELAISLINWARDKGFKFCTVAECKFLLLDKV
ncbi:carbohydrate esterase family 4 protein [Phycomyces blakesleeanus NRRL 1555(-)]|uniref:Carbohydrate esterase family 4 protein n=1 Tax=Phycomyces blakesleeanus (strain ATCC 8743b / DSM 1359 / FGSC 10004 / NBRC 33097 / NRRL 1555) TaxID=763407 RepID=A0A162PP22_PHYB8|nr:carbohydrate esterase family 4 protein [Phycomyces blakesleeanus NRRL 1555(-)]OAD71576.1 carbohydrate esterase family 4 protein [Phycomyces blakesleeanus NRRL 1555(-)]|eukprot:XP_018289616.1 carbohydrate esterase family 4 protein [Phycomyces blakesleeanus NRRL 1555(-)]